MAEFLTKYDGMDEADQIKFFQKALIYWLPLHDEETIKTMEKLKQWLREATEEDAEYEKYIEGQKRLLDNIYEEHKQLLNQRMNNADALFADVVDAEQK